MKWPLTHLLVLASLTPALVPAVFAITQIVVALANLAMGADARLELPWKFAAMFLAAVWLPWSPVIIGAILYARGRSARNWLVYGPIPAVAIATFIIALSPPGYPFLAAIWVCAACSIAAGIRAPRESAMPELPPTQ